MAGMENFYNDLIIINLYYMYNMYVSVSTVDDVISRGKK